MAHPDTKSAGGGFEKRRRENVGQGCARDRQAMLPFWGSYQAVLPHPPRRHTWCGAGHMHVLDGSKVHRGVVSRFALSCCRLDSADFESTSPETSSCAPMVALRRLFPSTSKTGTKRITPPTLPHLRNSSLVWSWRRDRTEHGCGGRAKQLHGNILGQDARDTSTRHKRTSSEADAFYAGRGGRSRATAKEGCVIKAGGLVDW